MPAIPIFVINLQRDTERRRHMEQQLEGLGLKAEFITAVDGRTLSQRERAACDRARSRRVYGREMTENEVGCYLSHHRLYERMIRERIETALIMEDDVRVDQNFPRILDELLFCPFTDWLVIRLDSKRTQVVDPPSAKFAGTRVADISGAAGLYRLRTRVLGVGAYLIKHEGAVRMLAYGRRIFMPIDQTLDRYWENGILPYVVRPLPVQQREDFGSSTGPRPFGGRRTQPLSGRLQCRVQRISDGVRKRAFNLANRKETKVPRP
ncbi:MAG: glycosyltransferase family 25 protein, partial [Acetobacteraceae bacterium]|nr:glycosyltransferase family 25 protein [Acetobacteraceae bacterium]